MPKAARSVQIGNCLRSLKVEPVQNCNCHICDSFIHSIGMCRMRQLLAVLGSFVHSSLPYTLSFHPFPPTSLPSFLTSSCHLFLGLPVSLVVSIFIYNTFLGNLYSSILCTCPNYRICAWHPKISKAMQL